MKRVTMTIIVEKDLQRAFKMAALKQNKSMTEILVECMKKTIKGVKEIKNG